MYFYLPAPKVLTECTVCDILYVQVERELVAFNSFERAFFMTSACFFFLIIFQFYFLTWQAHVNLPYYNGRSRDVRKSCRCCQPPFLCLYVSLPLWPRLFLCFQVLSFHRVYFIQNTAAAHYASGERKVPKKQEEPTLLGVGSVSCIQAIRRASAVRNVPFNIVA